MSDHIRVVGDLKCFQEHLLTNFLIIQFVVYSVLTP